MRQNKLPLPVFCLDRDKLGVLVAIVICLFVNTDHQHLFGEQHPVVTGFWWSLAEAKDAQVTSARKVLGPCCQHSASNPESYPPPSTCRTKSNIPQVLCLEATANTTPRCQSTHTHKYIYKLFQVGVSLKNICTTYMWVTLLLCTKEQWVCTALVRKKGQTCVYQGSYKSVNINVKFGLAIWPHQEKDQGFKSVARKFCNMVRGSVQGTTDAYS